jgi:parallel beta helix pectate lyase-like protein
MKPRLWKKLATILVVGLCPLNFIGVVQAAAIPLPPILNVSTDLDQLPSPYNAANMIPNSAQDSAQLLNDAIRWVSYYNSENPSTPYTKITAEKGVYNFLCTTKFGGREVYILVQPESKNSVLQNVVIDLNGSDLFFSQPYNEAVTINDCQNLTLENFSIDYTTLPFTQLLVQSIVNSTTITVTLESALPGQTPWVPVPNLPQSEATLYGFDFRNGYPLYAAGRSTIEPSSSSSTVTFKQGNTNLIQVGDVFEVEARGGGPAIWLGGNSSGILLENLSIYSTGGIGIETEYSPGVSIRNVSIVPRPETNRLVSTNAGGIALNQTAANNTIENCLIEGTQDDSISGNAPALGYAEFPVLSTNLLALTQATSLVEPDIKVYFVDPITMTAVRDPSSLRKAVRKIKTVAAPGSNPYTLVTMTKDLPSDLPDNVMMYDVRRATRGDGLLIDGNTILSNTLARGIALSGQTGVTIRNNLINSTEEAGILCSSSYAPDPKANGVYSTYAPMSDLKIQNNELIDADSGTGPGLGLSELAAIQLVDGNSNNDPATSPVFRNVIITDNQIINTPRTGIWIMNVLGGLVTGNTLTNTGYNTNLVTPSHIPSGYGITGSQAMKDFGTPVLIQTSTVVVGKNPVN